MKQNVARFEGMLREHAAILASTFDRQRELFGEPWETEFDELIGRFAGVSDDDLKKAVVGYADFAIDGMRLQREFIKTGRYKATSHAEAGKIVYHNPEYMFGLYLPGILLSHYLWPHHYRQSQFFDRTLRAALAEAGETSFCDIGPGTGFYCRRLLASNSAAKGYAFDISESSIEYTRRHAEAFGVSDRLHIVNQNVVTEPVGKEFPFLVCVEVLEHLEAPQEFLNAIGTMLAPGGKGIIAAAVTAANEDHIFLYNNGDEVAAQVEQAGFKILDRQYDSAYEPRKGEPVPIDAAFFVTKE